MKWFKKEKSELETEMDSVTERLANIDPGSGCRSECDRGRKCDLQR